jgi:DNA invertase Pin-like site-specific DNA recombinase
MNTAAPAKRQAISYIRYSSAAQGQQGRDSTRRQTKALQDALTRWNLDLDQEFTDKAKSSFHQKHLAKGGAMYAIRELAKSGELRGKVLVVEDFDRVGRMTPLEAAPLLSDILNNGVDMVVGANGGEFFSKDTVNANGFLFYKALDSMNRGHGESKRKNEIATERWKERMEKVSKGEPVALNCLPWWLFNEKNGEGKFTGQYKLRDGMRDLVREIFRLYIGGNGTQVIGNILRKRGVPMPVCRNDNKPRINANVWHGTFVRRVIKNRAVMGYYQNTNHKIFPEIIDETTFYQANQKRKERTQPQFAGRHSERINPFHGLLKCPVCNNGMSIHGSRGTNEKDYRYIECRSSRTGACSGQGMPYNRFEESFMGFFTRLEGLTANEIKTVAKSETLKAMIAEAEQQKKMFQAAFAGLKDVSRAVTLGNMLTDCDTKLEQLQKDFQTELTAERGAQPFAQNDMAFLRNLYANPKAMDDNKTRLIIQEALRRGIEKIVVDVQTQSYTVKWRNSTDTHFVQLLINGFEVYKNDMKKPMVRIIDFNVPTVKKGRNRFPTITERLAKGIKAPVRKVETEKPAEPANEKKPNKIKVGKYLNDPKYLENLKKQEQTHSN